MSPLPNSAPVTSRPVRSWVFGLFVVLLVALPGASAASAAPPPGVNLTPLVLKARAAVGLPEVRSELSRRRRRRRPPGRPERVSGLHGRRRRRSARHRNRVVRRGALDGADQERRFRSPRDGARRLRAETATSPSRRHSIQRARSGRRSWRARSSTRESTGSLAVLFPPRTGRSRDLARRGTEEARWSRSGSSRRRCPASRRGDPRVGLKGLDRMTGPELGYGLDLHAEDREQRTPTAYDLPLPPVLVARRSSPARASPEPTASVPERRRPLPPSRRKIVDVFRGAITVSRPEDRADVRWQTSCAGFDPGDGYFLILNRAQLHSYDGRLRHRPRARAPRRLPRARHVLARRTSGSSSPSHRSWKTLLPPARAVQSLPRALRRPVRVLLDERTGRAIGLRRRAPGDRRGVREAPPGAVGLPSTPGPQPARRLRPAREELRDRDAQQAEGAL